MDIKIFLVIALIAITTSGCIAPDNVKVICGTFHNEVYNEDIIVLYPDGTFIISQPQIRGGNLAGTYKLVEDTAMFMITTHGTVIKFDLKPGNMLKDPQGDLWIKK